MMRETVAMLVVAGLATLPGPAMAASVGGSGSDGDWCGSNPREVGRDVDARDCTVTATPMIQHIVAFILVACRVLARYPTPLTLGRA